MGGAFRTSHVAVWARHLQPAKQGDFTKTIPAKVRSDLRPYLLEIR
jgi:hypothetical protein